MIDYRNLCADYYRIEQAIRYLEENFSRQPTLADTAAAAGLSEYHFQRLFSRWVGISPKRFLQYLTKEYAKKLIENSLNVLDAAHDSGLSSPSRLHDLFVNCEAVTPGEYRNKGESIHISYGFHPSPFGECLLAVTERGICFLHFLYGENHQEAITRLRKQWPQSSIENHPHKTEPLIPEIFKMTADGKPAPLYLFVRGTNFQIKVWEALLKIPPGEAVSYEDLARHIGRPKATRAVGNAVGKNPIPFLIPCHRVLRKLGEFGNYGGGTARKKAIFGWEAARNRTSG